MGVLDEILRRKRERKSALSLAELKSRIRDMEKPRDFRAALRRDSGRIKLIAEIKKASPSKGLIRKDFDPAGIARIYDDRADAISVLTEEDFFLGSLRSIGDVKAASGRPVLRKDFIFEEYQIYESRAAGADALLLIERILEPSQAGEYLHMAEDLGMSALLEVHDVKGLEKALRLDADIIGINNRNLDTLKTDIETTFELKKEMPRGKVVVSESGIETRKDVLRLEEAGIDALLIGTAFMESEDIGRKIDELFGER